jgi:phenylacetate-CoA ligase
MPLINYKVGDKLIFAPGLCECGRTLKLIDSIEGRAGDVIIKPNGEKLSQYFFYYAAKNLDSMGYANGILKYKVIQNGNNFDYFIVKGNNFKEEILEYLLEKMKDTIGKSITVRFHFVEEIPRESSGKLRFFKREI